MKTRSNRLNNGYIGDSNLTTPINGIISSNQRYLDVEESFSGLEGLYPYRRPNEWIAMPSVTAGQQIFIGTFAVYDTDENLAVLSANTSTGNYLVDWGNGTTSAHSSASTASKKFTRSDYAGLTSAVYENYKTLNITVTPVTGNITSMTLNVELAGVFFLLARRSRNWLDIRASLPNATTVTLNSTKTLQQFELINSNSLNNCDSMFSDCWGLKRAVIADTSKVTNFTRMFQNCYSLYELPQMNTINGGNFYGFALGCHSLKYISNLNLQNATTLGQAFESCYSLKTVPFLNAPQVTEMQQCFNNCYNLEYIPYLHTPLVTTFANTFLNCSSLKKIGKINTSSVTNMTSAFSGCFKLKTTPLLNTSNVTNFSNMFFNCTNLNYVAHFNTSSATDMSSMFRNCSNLKRAPNLNTSNVQFFNNMFFFCVSLEYVPNYNLEKGVNFSTMLYNCSNLKTWDVTYNGPTSGVTLATTAFQGLFAAAGSNSLMGLSFWNFLAATGASYANVFNTMFDSNHSLMYLGFTGISQNFTVANNWLGSTALNNLYTSLAVVGASGSGTKTITVSNCIGVANDNPNIAIEKGWTVTG
jgi:surface protein